MTPTPAYDIKIDQLSFSYPDGRKALSDISFAIGPREKVALIGTNGSGKSTLLLNLNGVLRASAGNVTVSNLSLNDSTIPQIRGWVGLLFQNPDDQLFSQRVYDDGALSRDV